MRILVFDPGNSTGWVMHDTQTKKTYGGTFKEDLCYLKYLFDKYKPDLVIYEVFALYPALAQKLLWNTFYPVEVIGVLRFLSLEYDAVFKDQAPSVKKYAGRVDFNDINLEVNQKLTPHVKDAYLHLMYYLRNNHD